MKANSNIHTRTATYLVWQKGQNPESGRLIEAMSGYDARRKVSEEATPPIHILSLMARLVPPEPHHAE